MYQRRRKMPVQRYIVLSGLVAAVFMIIIYRFTSSAVSVPIAHMSEEKNAIGQTAGSNTHLTSGGEEEDTAGVIGRSRGSGKAWSFTDQESHVEGKEGKNEVIINDDIIDNVNRNENIKDEPQTKIDAVSGKKDETKRAVLLKHNNSEQFPFMDTSLSWDERVEDLVSRLTVEEAVAQSQAVYGVPTPSIERLGIKPYQWITECLHGLYYTHGTAFPAPIGLAATFSPELVHNVSLMTSYEARAHWNSLRKKDTFRVFIGLTCFSPTINIMRHPMWGRNQETYGEDPFLTGVLAASYVRGLQGNHSRYVRVAAGCKHFAAHSGPEKTPESRYTFNAQVRESDLRMTYLPQFKECIAAGSLGLMCSYNKVNGVPACANVKLLTDIARHLWGFKGYVVSDAGAIRNIMTKHKYRENAVDTVMSAIKAGCNLELSHQAPAMYEHQVQARNQGLLTDHEIKNNVKPLFYTRMRLGEFDPPEMNPYNAVNMSVVQRGRHRRRAVQAAMMSFVLLKNIGNTLPLKRTLYQKVTIFGPLANATQWLYGSYAPQYSPEYSQSLLDWLPLLAKSHAYIPGCEVPRCLQYDDEKIVRAARDRDTDLIIVAVGSAGLEGEYADRGDMSLPGYYHQMLLDVVSGSDPRVPVVVLVFSGGPVDISWAQASGRVGAILACFLPAQATGQAVFNTLIMNGTHSVPAARLPFTWPKTVKQVPSITHYHMEGHTYRYFSEDVEPLYPFGYGLSYSKFKYSSLSVKPAIITQGEHVTVTVTVTNMGPFNAEEVTQIYMSWNQLQLSWVPKIQLVGFRRVFLEVNQPVSLNFTIASSQMSVWIDDATGYTVLPVPMMIYASGGLPTKSLLASRSVLESSFMIRENKNQPTGMANGKKSQPDFLHKTPQRLKEMPQVEKVVIRNSTHEIYQKHTIPNSSVKQQEFLKERTASVNYKEKPPSEVLTGPKDGG